ncbi:alpha/beta hydrolase [Bariatricus sp. SGI.154]|uniref:alpha/beta hydrolase n=1 Tax=Bariatricus sp. SGI.154 TaxID=3420549 RepID=UPI003D094705
MAIIRVRFFSNCLMRTVPFTAVLPNDGGFLKDGSPDFVLENMKTLYLLHGYTGDENDYLVHTHISELSKKYGIAVIMPDGDNSFYIDHVAENRHFGKYIGEELVEYTRRLFPLSKEREDTYIGGLSMGGYGAMRNGLKYAHTFSKILAFSGAYIPIRIVDNGGVPVDDGVSNVEFQCRVFGDPKMLATSDLDPRVIYQELEKSKKSIPRIFMTEGSEDFLLKENHAMRDFLQAQNADFTYIEDTGEHDWDFWNKHLEEAFAFLNE